MFKKYLYRSVDDLEVIVFVLFCFFGLKKLFCNFLGSCC